MAGGAALSKPVELLDHPAAPLRPVAAAHGLSFSLSHDLKSVEAIWRTLAAQGIESPGQDFDFVRLWIEANRIRPADQFYFVATEAGRPFALVPLHRRWVKGARVLSWFPGPHVGCNAPLVDHEALLAMNSGERTGFWQRLLREAAGADVVYLKAIPQLMIEGVDLFAELGRSLVAETLYRAVFSSWDEANTTQRSKSRRKHDRQQGDKLDALGAVSFETLSNGDEALGVLDLMFRQRAARFRELGVWDPFSEPDVRAFYDSTVRANSGVAVKLHLLRLNGEIVAIRYNIVAGDRLFCLISSMSDDPAIQIGSPGKQCLLRVMQTEFDSGARMFDMGAGFTDEKRHWCNVQIPVRQHYVPVTRRGAVSVSAHIGWQVLRQRIKNDPRLLELAKRFRGQMVRFGGKRAVTSATPPSED